MRIHLGVLLALLIMLPAATAWSTHHTTRFWYDDHRHHGPIFASNLIVPGQTFYHYTPPRRITINPHHTQALCQWNCAPHTSTHRPYIVITNQHISQPSGPTYAIAHHQHRVVQTPQPAARSTTSTVYHTHYHHTQPTHHVHNHYW